MSKIASILLPVPIDKVFDYLIPETLAHALVKGARVRVPFGRRHLVGLVNEVKSQSDYERSKLKVVAEALEPEQLLTDEIWQLGCFAAKYYHHPLGEVLLSALPPYLREGKTATFEPEWGWATTEFATDEALDSLKRAHQQARALSYLITQPEPILQAALQEKGFSPAVLKSLSEKNLIGKVPLTQPVSKKAQQVPISLNAEQASAVKEVSQSFGQFRSFLLEGVTGSGKTEVYLTLIQQVLDLGKQALVLVPEISLTPQLLDRFYARFDVPIGVLHSACPKQQKAKTWMRARQGEIKIIIGTRSAVFTPLPALGIVIVDEEHDLSFKQQEGFRYSGRDLAVVRASQRKVPVVLGSATPSLELSHQVAQGKAAKLSLPHRAGQAKKPTIKLIDVRNQKLTGGLSNPMVEAIKQHLSQRAQVLLFLNRRGFAPVLMCHQCGWVSECRRCDARMIVHQSPQKLICHQCESTQPLPHQCGRCTSRQLIPVGQGTERLESTLNQIFPEARVVRVDRDVVSTQNKLEEALDKIKSGEADIIIGTQMLAKGHHFPNVTMVGILQADDGLFSADFRGQERFAQLFVQVAGRAGRGERAGQVYVQTHQPDHPMLIQLLTEGFAACAETLLKERKLTELPPYACLALWRARAHQMTHAMAFLTELAQYLKSQVGHQQHVLGPFPAVMKKRSGQFHAQLLLQTEDRAQRHDLLTKACQWVANSPLSKKVKWSLDVDPQSLY